MSRSRAMRAARPGVSQLSRGSLSATRRFGIASARSREPHRAHAAAADLAQQPVRADEHAGLRTGHHDVGFGGDAHPDRRAHEAVERVIGARQQVLQRGLDLGLLRRKAIEPAATVSDRQRERFVQQRSQPRPVGRVAAG